MCIICAILSNCLGQMEAKNSKSLNIRQFSDNCYKINNNHRSIKKTISFKIQGILTNLPMC